MDAPVHEESYKGHSIKIYYDTDAENPRDWDNLGTMICGHSRYQLGDKHAFDGGRAFLLDLLGLDEECSLDIDQLLRRAEKMAIVLPVYLYDHSGLAMNTSGFHCPWDSGQVGFIYVTCADVRKEFSAKTCFAKAPRESGWLSTPGSSDVQRLCFWLSLWLCRRKGRRRDRQLLGVHR